MSTVALTAATGMLGSALYRQLRDRFDLVLLHRDARLLAALDATYGGVAGHRALRVDYAQLYREFRVRGEAAVAELVERIGPVDAVVNSAGVIIPHAHAAPELTFFVNGALPHLLAARYGSRLVHITTDCVFSGRSGAPYDERAAACPHDLYGLSKAMGEPPSALVLRTSIVGPELGGRLSKAMGEPPSALVLRTSIVGPELGGRRSSLLEWLRGHAGAAVDGYVNHWWNGVTTVELADAVARVLEHRDAVPATGTFHVFGAAVSKCELLEAINARYSLRVAVRPRAVEGVDRRLATVHPLNEWLGIAPLAAQLARLP